MHEIEAMLQRDRQAGLPEPPDLRYTAAAVRRRMAGQPRSRRDDNADWPLVLAGGGTLLATVTLALLLGLPAVWLWSVPVVGLALCPILLRKGV
ncbi:MAG: hypothetical protein ACM3XM_07520 [Mycobacterium leprae]